MRLAALNVFNANGAGDGNHYMDLGGLSFIAKKLYCFTSEEPVASIGSEMITTRPSSSGQET